MTKLVTVNCRSKHFFGCVFFRLKFLSKVSLGADIDISEWFICMNWFSEVMRYLAIMLISFGWVWSYVTNWLTWWWHARTAPQTDYDLMHPEWGVVQTTRVASNRGYSMQSNTHQQTTITNYGRGVSGQRCVKVSWDKTVSISVLPGNHVMVKQMYVNFKTGSAFPEPAYNHWLDTLGDYLSQRQDIDVVIEGHTDNTGSDQINDPLSEQRAKGESYD